jgi:predicted negative regulator of RcsB-dependent stress response
VEDLSDLEREEQLRNFWRENWLTILGGIVIGLAAIAGWRYWQARGNARAERAEAAYASVIDALSANQRDQALERAKQLRADNPRSPYADQAELALARAAVERRDLDEAVRLLRGIVDGSHDEDLRHVARTRLARVLIEQGKHADALALLDPAKAGAYAAMYQEIRGDAYAASGDTAAARREYDTVLAAAEADSGIDRQFVKLKREALPPVANAGVAAK